MDRRFSVRGVLKTHGIPRALIAFALFIVVYIIFGIINPMVFSPANIINLLRAMSIYLLVGIGQSYVMITGNIDLSIGSIVGLSSIVSWTLMYRKIYVAGQSFIPAGVPASYAVLITLVCCLAVGLINGFLVGRFKLPASIATLGTMYLARGVAHMVNNNRSGDAIAGGIGKEAADKFQDFFYYGKTYGIYNTFLIAMAIFIGFFFLLSKTKTGRHIYAVGSNTEAAKLSGVNVQVTIIKTYLVSSFAACVVGLMLVAQATMGNMEAGNGYEIYGVAAGVIGGISPLGGAGNLLGTLAGAAVWQTLQNGLSMVGAQVGIQRIVIGAITIVAVLLDVLLRNRKIRRYATTN